MFDYLPLGCVQLPYVIEGYDQPKKAYHYCTNDTLFAILTSKCFRLTHTNFLNDSTEIQESYQLYKVALENGCELSYNIDVKNSYFVACFCKNADDLTAFRAYGDDARGVSIEFEMDHYDFWGKLKHISPKDTFQLFNFHYIAAADVLYSSENKEKVFKQAKISFQGLNFSRNSCAADLVFHPFLKHHSFIDEKEFRIALRIREDKEYEVVPQVQSYNDGKKYIDLPFHRFQSQNKFPITKIILGTKNRMTLEELQAKLADFGLADIIVEKSKIPYQ